MVNSRKSVYFLLFLALVIFEIWVWSDYLKKREQQTQTQLVSQSVNYKQKTVLSSRDNAGLKTTATSQSQETLEEL